MAHTRGATCSTQQRSTEARSAASNARAQCAGGVKKQIGLPLPPRGSAGDKGRRGGQPAQRKHTSSSLRSCDQHLRPGAEGRARRLGGRWTTPWPASTEGPPSSWRRSWLPSKVLPPKPRTMLGPLAKPPRTARPCRASQPPPTVSAVAPPPPCDLGRRLAGTSGACRPRQVGSCSSVRCPTPR